MSDKKGYDTKGSRKALGAMNAKLRSKVSKLQQEVNSLKYLLSQGKDCCKCPYLLGKK